MALISFGAAAGIAIAFGAMLRQMIRETKQRGISAPNR